MKKVVGHIYRINELSPKAKDYAIRSYDKYNNPNQRLTLAQIDKKLNTSEYYFKANGEMWFGFN